MKQNRQNRCDETHGFAEARLVMRLRVGVGAGGRAGYFCGGRLGVDGAESHELCKGRGAAPAQRQLPVPRPGAIFVRCLRLTWKK